MKVYELETYPRANGWYVFHWAGCWHKKGRLYLLGGWGAEIDAYYQSSQITDNKAVPCLHCMLDLSRQMSCWDSENNRFAKYSY